MVFFGLGLDRKFWGWLWGSDVTRLAVLKILPGAIRRLVSESLFRSACIVVVAFRSQCAFCI